MNKKELKQARKLAIAEEAKVRTEILNKGLKSAELVRKSLVLNDQVMKGHKYFTGDWDYIIMPVDLVEISADLAEAEGVESPL